jgi:hypothetical protein
MLKMGWPGSVLVGLMGAVIGLVLTIALEYGGLVLFALLATGLVVGLLVGIVSGRAGPYEDLLRNLLSWSAAISVAILSYQWHIPLWLVLVIAVPVGLLLYGLLHVDYGRLFHKRGRHRNNSS